MTSLLLPTRAMQHLHPSSHRPLHTVVHTIHHRDSDDDGSDGDDSDDDGDHKVRPTVCTLPPGCFGLDLVLCTFECPPLHPSHTPTWSVFSSSLPMSTTTQTVTHTAIPSGSGSAASTTTGDNSTAPTVPISSSGAPGKVVADNQGLSAGELTGAIVGSVGGALLLLLFLWLWRRGTFGSGTLFGFRYGDARKPGWGGATQEMRQKNREGYRISASATPSDSSTLFVPFLPGAKSSSYSHPPSDSSVSVHKPPSFPRRSPPPWSTSSSAFDNAYPVSTISAHTRSHTNSASLSVSMSVSISDNSTLVSEPAYLRPPERNPNTSASASPLARYLNTYRPTSIPLTRRPPSPGETVSTSMVSFDRTDPDNFDPDLSEVASSDARSEWEVDTAESSQPLGRHFRGSGSGGEGG